MKNRIILKALNKLSLSPLQIARYAQQNTRLYHDLYASRSLDDFSQVPVLSKGHLLLLDPYALLSRDFRKKVILYGETSGSSGCPTPVFFTRNDIRLLIALAYLSPFVPLVKKAIKVNRTAMNGLTFGFTIAGYSFGLILQMGGALVANLGSRSTIAHPERTARALCGLSPSIICATPLDFMAWMEIIRRDFPAEYEPVLKHLQFLLSTAEPCANSRQAQIEAHFGITHIDTYATVDGFETIPCLCGKKHLLDDIYHVELYDRTMEKTDHQGTGRLCFTNLIKRSAPMVKYLLDDLVTITPSQCPYGFRWDIKPHGRYELSMDINLMTLGTLDFEEIIYKYGLFMDYRLELRDNGLWLDLEEYPGAADKYDLNGLTDALEVLTGYHCSLTMHPMGKLTEFRKVRNAKSVIKILDKRKTSYQKLPQIL